MPRIALSGVLAITALSISTYNYIILPLARKFYDLSFINFKILFKIKDFINNFNLLDINYMNLFLGFVSLGIGMLIIYYAHKNTKEKIFKYGLWSIPAYIISYSLLASLVWLSVFIELLINRVQKW